MNLTVLGLCLHRRERRRICQVRWLRLDASSRDGLLSGLLEKLRHEIRTSNSAG